MISEIDSCPVCGATEFLDRLVLWPELENAWQLSKVEVAYVNRQQGYHCVSCKNNLRAMGLAAAIVNEYSFKGSLEKFCQASLEIDLLEINGAGNLTQSFRHLKRHKLVEYPEYDMLNLQIESASFDLVVHSDTLEHVPYPERGLSECRRVLRSNGRCIFTVPVIVDRLTRSRSGLAPSFHGRSGVPSEDQIVRTEFGADVWQTVLKSGFRSCEIFCYEFPASLVVIARK
jgi:SAM-dependent methyltransferase